MKSGWLAGLRTFSGTADRHRAALERAGPRGAAGPALQGCGFRPQGGPRDEAIAPGGLRARFSPTRGRGTGEGMQSQSREVVTLA